MNFTTHLAFDFGSLRGVQDAIGVDLGDWWGPLGRSLLRLLLLVVCARLVLGVLRRIIARVDDSRLREQLLFFAPKVVQVVAGVSALAVIGIDVSGMAAVMATVGFTGAVIFTSVGQNLVAGAMIRIDDIYRVGEAVTIGDLHGTVVYRTMLRTELELPDGSKAWVPNSAFQDGQVLNHSRLGGWRVCVEVPLDCAADRALAHEVMTRVMEKISWNCDDKPAFVAFDHVGSEAMFSTPTPGSSIAHRSRGTEVCCSANSWTHSKQPACPSARPPTCRWVPAAATPS